MIDCADFYRAIHAAICKAQHSIFILGWEIDSRIRLLRGEEEKNSAVPSTTIDLLSWKAEQNKNIQIYLLRWDSSAAFITKRELLAEYIWSLKTPENVHICLDNMVPLGGSHHQKIILIDDELVFTGGMDIASSRWDERAHRIHEPERADVLGPYGPYHDVQVMMEGPITKDFSELVRWRWFLASGIKLPNPAPPPTSSPLVLSWPEMFKPFIRDIPVAISRTIPEMEGVSEVQEVKQMYLDLIAQAEKFIYAENQFFSSLEIADAINYQLKRKKSLKVLLVSSYNPQGVLERESLWAGRIDFKQRLEAGVNPVKVRMTYPCIKDEKGEFHYKRIHSKVLIIDDKYCTIASSNINNRSLSLDTECDITLEAQNSLHSQQITDFRNDLLSEHCGKSKETLAQLFHSEAPLPDILLNPNESSYTLKEINDSIFTNKELQPLAQVFADSKEPLFGKGYSLRNPRKHVVIFSLISVLGVSLIIGLLRHYGSLFTPENLRSLIEMSRVSQWSLPLVCLAYVIGGFILFPLSVLTLITSVVYGAIKGPIYSMCGALLSGAIMYGIGHLIGVAGVRKLLGHRLLRIDRYFKKSGIFGVILLRFLPIAPYSIVNLAAGICSISFTNFILGSFLGFLPSFIIKGFVGSSLMEAILSPTTQTKIYLGLGLLLWFLLALSSYWLARKRQRRLNL